MAKYFGRVFALILFGVSAYFGANQFEGKGVEEAPADRKTRAVVDATVGFLKTLSKSPTMHVHTIYRDPTNDYGIKLTGAK